MENAGSPEAAAAAADTLDAANADARDDVRARRRAFAPATVRRAAYLATGAVTIGFVFWWLQFSTDAICCGDFDGYYHIGWSQQLWQGIRTGRFPPGFIWLPLTTLNARDYVDHHFLFHILQIPFTFFSDVRTGAKISAWLFGTLALLSCYWMIVRYRIKYPLLWLVALLGCSAPFLFRMNMTKAMSVSIVLLIMGIHLLFQRKYLWLLPLAFFFTLTYDMFVLLGLVAFIWTAVLLWSEGRFEWRPLAWVSVGIIAGTVINPYFPHNVQLLYAHILMKFTAKGFSTAVGQEWYPYESWDFARNCAVAFVAMAAGYIAFNWQDRKRTAQPLFFLIFSTILLIANARWRRFAEYWPPFAVLFAAFSLQLVFERARAYTRLPDDVLDELQPYLDRHERPADDEKKFDEVWTEVEAFVIGLVLSVLLFGLLATKQVGLFLQIALLASAYLVLALPYLKWRGARMATLTTISLVLFTSLLVTAKAESIEIATTAPHKEYTKGIEWMRTHIPAGQVIFNTDWDDFPKLFYYDPTHAYVSGLDPTYLYDKDQELSRLYEEITLGRNKDPGPIIRDRFGARYVFTDNEDVHNDFYDAAMDSGWFDEVYTDKDCTVLYIREQKGAPAPEEPDDDNNLTPDDAPPGDDAEETDEESAT
jgi:hypothetical protein